MHAASILVSGLILFVVGTAWMFRGTPGLAKPDKSAGEERVVFFERLGLFLLLAGTGILLWGLEALARHG